MRRLWLLAFVAACQSAPQATVHIDATAFRRALGSLELERLEVRVEASDFSEPMIATVENDRFSLRVPAGFERRFSLVATVVGDIPAYFAEKRVNLEPGVDLELVLEAHAVGVIEATLETIDASDVPESVAATLVRDDAPWFDGVTNVFEGQVRIVAPVGKSTLRARYVSEAAVVYSTLDTEIVTVEHAKVTAATFHALKKNDRCRKDAPESLAPLGPACVPLLVNVSGIGSKTIVLTNDGVDRLTASEGRSTFPVGVEVGNDYDVRVVQAPAGVTCTVADPIGTAEASVPPSVEVSCAAPLTLSVRGLRGTLATPLVVTVGTEVTTVTADGTFALQTTTNMSPTITIVQPGASEVDTFQCAVSRAPGMVGLDPIDVRCIGAVQPQYTSPLFLAWMKKADTTQACSEAVAEPCVHAGVARVAHVYDRSGCAGLTANDARDVFDWVCEIAGDHVRLRSTGLRPGRGLISLVDFPSCAMDDQPCSFLPLTLSLTEPGGERQSAATVWWQDVVRRDDDLSAAPVSGTITVSETTALSDTQLGTYLAQPRVALVMKPGTVTNVDAISLDGPLSWLEGASFVANGAPIDTFLELAGAHFTVRNSYLRGGPLAVMEFGAYSVIEDVALKGALDRGLVLGDPFGDGPTDGIVARRVSVDSIVGAGVGIIGSWSTGLVLEDAVTVNNLGAGLQFDGSASDTARVRRITAFNNTSHGIDTGQLQRSSLVDLTTFNNGQHGVLLPFVSSDADLFVANITSANNGAPQVTTVSNAAVVANALSFNGAGGVEVIGADRIVFDTFAGFALDTDQLRFSGLSNAPELRRIAAYSGAPLCDDGASNTLLATTCTTSGSDGSADWPCGPAQCSAVLRSKTLGPAFVGFVSADQVNPFGVSGQQSLIGVNDASGSPWTLFEHRRRGYVRQPSAAMFPDSSQRATCSVTEICAIFDWRPVTGGMLHEALPVPTAADVLTAYRFTGGVALTQSDCDTFHPGTTLIEIVPFMTYGCRATFLAGAVELDDDGLGHDNGFCEAGDDCLVTLNFGADQGEGALVSVATVPVGAGTARLFRRFTTGY